MVNKLRFMTIFTASCGFALLLSSPAMAQGIYTCVDGKGRKITSDRQIPECADRAQQEITPSGTVKRVLPATLTAQDRAAQEEKDRQVAELRSVGAEEKRRDRALLLRYPTRAVHDRERELALAQVDDVIKASSKRSQELAGQRRLINTELEFYKKDLGKAPLPLKRRLEENDSNTAMQKQFVADQDFEKKRLNARFDEDAVKLKQLWALTGMAATPVSTASAEKKQ